MSPGQRNGPAGNGTGSDSSTTSRAGCHKTTAALAAVLLIAVVSAAGALALAAGSTRPTCPWGCAMTAPLPDVAEVGADNVAQMAEAALIGAVLLLRGQDARAALDRVEVVDLADPRHRAIWTGPALPARGRVRP